ncbi:hypothetical protein [Nostoc sp. DSM 114167]|jgi:hypothetical protein|uniref:hypothetical protein n=1 Tax=Nostoc sp. DSM 114167 TaxID=3439050 RepID=UPI0040465DF5
MKQVSPPSMKEELGTGNWELVFLLSTQHSALSTFKSVGVAFPRPSNNPERLCYKKPAPVS